MLKWMLAAGAAALAIATPVLAEKGHGGGKGGGNNHAAHSAKAGGGGGGHRSVAQDSRGGGGNRSDHLQKSHGNGGGDRSHQVRMAQNQERGHGRSGDNVRVKNHDNDRGHKQAMFENRQGANHQGNQGNRLARFDDDHIRGRNWDDNVHVARLNRHDDDFRWTPRWDGNGFRRGFADGCPPGLAKKGNGCLPPGQARKLVGTVLAPTVMSRSLVGPYRLWYPDNDNFIYRWDDDNIYRVRRNGGLIDAMFPYANRDYYYYPTGVTYPDYYNYYNVPYQYQSFYPDGGDYLYRYGDGAIYMVDPQTQMIQGIAALLTGAPMTVGQPLPPAYGVYNVPLAYRSTYYDTPDNWYRYNDGYIYRVDPATQLITAVISAIV